MLKAEDEFNKLGWLPAREGKGVICLLVNRAGRVVAVCRSMFKQVGDRTVWLHAEASAARRSLLRGHQG